MSEARKRRRHIKGVSRKAARNIAKSNGVNVTNEVMASPEVQAAKITALEAAVERLVIMSQTNHAEIVKAFQVTDAHLWVLRQICKDVVSGEVMLLKTEGQHTDEKPSVDLGAYYDLFNAHQKQEQEKAAKAKALKEAGVKSNLTEEPEVFGGDASHAGT